MYARMTTFSGLTADEARGIGAEIDQRSEGGPPEGVPSTGITVLVDAEGGRVLVLGLFATKADRTAGDAVLRAMEPPSEAAAGKRTAVENFDVAVERRV